MNEVDLLLDSHGPLFVGEELLTSGGASLFRVEFARLLGKPFAGWPGISLPAWRQHQLAMNSMYFASELKDYTWARDRREVMPTVSPRSIDSTTWREKKLLVFQGCRVFSKSVYLLRQSI